MSNTTLTFDGSHSGDIYVENGYVFTATYHDSDPHPSMLGGVGALDFDYRNVTVEVHRLDSGVFNFVSVDFDGRVPGGGGEGPGLYQTVDVIGASTTGHGGELLAAFDNNLGFQTFTPADGLFQIGGLDTDPSWSDVTSMTITSYSGFGVNGIVMDNFVVSLSPPPSTTFIDFEDGSQFVDNNGIVAHDTYHQNGFTLKTPSDSGRTETMSDPLGHPSGLADDYIQVFHLALELTKDDGSAFGVSSVDLDGFDNDPGNPASVTFTGTLAGGNTVSFTTVLDSDTGFQTVVLPGSFASGLIELSFISLNDDALNVDNIRFANGLALNGTKNNDVINGVQSGSTTIDGKQGVDTVDFGAATGGVNANLATGVATGPGVSDTLVNVENLTGSGHDDTLTGSAANNVLDGGAGDDGLYGGAGRDTLLGGAGADILDGGVANDVMAGGAGDDTYYVENAADVVTELPGDGYDTVYAATTWKATAGSEIEKIVLSGSAGIGATGNAFTVEIDGNGGANNLNDGGGAAVLKGGAGNDTYVVTNTGTTVQEDAGAGTDAINTSVDTFVLPANIEKLTYTGTDNFHATGTSGAETIIGGAGNDVIDGAGGADHLTGGGGADTFVFDAAAASGLVINDFQAGIDTFDLDFAGSATAFLVGTASTNGVLNHATVVYDAAHGKLYWEADGLASHKVLLASLTANLDLHAADFIFGGP
ncbi:MAG: putative calcium-binding protein [Caulobacter sp.]|nr:putative calcium-binding protein [Caulobacter sp.]